MGKNKLDDLSSLDFLSSLNSLNSFNQTNGSLPPDLFHNIASLNNLNLNNLSSLGSLSSSLNGGLGSLASLNGSLSDNLNGSHQSSTNTNANHQFSPMHPHPNQQQLANHQFNKNAITSEFTSQSSMVYPNLPFYQQQQSSKLTLSSNTVSPPTPLSFGFHPYLTAAIQQQILNHNFLQSAIFQQPQLSTQQQQLLLQNSLNNLSSLTSIGSLGSSTNDFSNHLNHLNLLNETFLSNSSNLNYPPSQLTNDFNFILNPPPVPTSQQQQQQQQQHSIQKPPKKQKLEPVGELNSPLPLNRIKKKAFDPDPAIRPIKEENVLNHVLDSVLDSCKDACKGFKFEELKVQTNNYLNQKLEDEKKFSPDSSTELASTIPKRSPNLLSCIPNVNNQSPIITSTKSSSSEHSTSPDVPLHSSLNAIDQCSKLSTEDLNRSLNRSLSSELEPVSNLVKEEDGRKDCESATCIDQDSNKNYAEEDLNEQHEEEEEDDDDRTNNELSIDFRSEEENNDNESTNDSTNQAVVHKQPIETEDLYSLISKRSFQPTTILNHKDVSLDRMSFDEEDDDDKSPINITFKNLIDSNLASNAHDDEVNSNRGGRSRSARRRKEANSSTGNPWVLRRSERIFLSECLSTGSNQHLLNEEKKEFKLSLKDLETDEPHRILIQVDDLLFAGLATRDGLTNKFCISLDDVNSAKNNLTLEVDRLIEEVIVEIKPKSIDQLDEGARVCAYWSQKSKCLYPGRVAKVTSGSSSSLSSMNGLKKEFVLVHFDDGDKTKIALDEIRLLPQAFELKPVETDEENNKSPSSNEGKKVEKLTIKLNGEMMSKKKKKHHSKHHKHHKKKHQRRSIESEDEAPSSEDERPESDWFGDEIDGVKSKKNSSSKIAAFLPERQLWKFHCEKERKPQKRAQKRVYHQSIRRGDEIIHLNDCAIFISAGRPSLPFVGRIVQMWESLNGNMFVRVKWFYHPEETTKKNLKLVDTKVSFIFVLFESFLIGSF